MLLLLLSFLERRGRYCERAKARPLIGPSRRRSKKGGRRQGGGASGRGGTRAVKHQKHHPPRTSDKKKTPLRFVCLFVYLLQEGSALAEVGAVCVEGCCLLVLLTELRVLLHGGMEQTAAICELQQVGLQLWTLLTLYLLPFAYRLSVVVVGAVFLDKFATHPVWHDLLHQSCCFFFLF